MQTRSRSSTSPFTGNLKLGNQADTTQALKNAEVVVATTPVAGHMKKSITIRFHHREMPPNFEPWTLAFPIFPGENNPPEPKASALLMANPFLNSATILECNHTFDAMQLTHHVLAISANCPKCGIGTNHRADPLDFHQFDFARDINRCILTIKQ